LRESGRTPLWQIWEWVSVDTWLGVAPGTPLQGEVMTENDRRESDVLTREDMLVRGFSVVALVSMFLLILLMVNP
jgi:hypothetical protein